MFLLTAINASNPKIMLPLVAGTGFLDGIHPCAIAILIFFIAFLISMQKAFKNILVMGLVYVGVIFLTYLAVGVGLLSGIMFFGQHHFFAKVGSYLLILLGVLSLRDGFLPRFRLGLKMPKFSNDKIRALLEKATLPTVAGAAFLVGLCSIPCSGGIYAAITSLLASQTTFFTGFLYLILYNLMFIAPLVILLLVAANPFTLVKLGEWQQRNRRQQLIIMGIAMLALGILFLIFIV
ncbi:hypothetical protein EPN28_04740 [Patescibacteria group bacterium]|nr:MAG: hypothetical protein EPN28_04740 [Patescibacteria group bacterium]